MKLPSRHIGPWAKEIISECSVSREERRLRSAFYQTLHMFGTTNGGRAKDNLCFNHVDKLSSYLFSPSDVRFDVSFEADEAPRWRGAADMTGRHLTREFRRNRCALSFAQGVDIALVDGCALGKLTWDANGWKTHIIRPHMFGVMREDLPSLDDQDAFVYFYYLTPSQFARMMRGDPRATEIIGRVQAQGPSPDRSDLESSYFHEIVAGGTNPVGTTSSSGQRANVSYVGSPTPMLDPKVKAQMIRVEELWVMNDEARKGQGDWSTIRMVGDVVIDGEYYSRNRFDVPGEHGFVKICPNEEPDYFWGRSELFSVESVQEWLNDRVNDVDRIFRLQAKPPRTFTGFSSITDEKARILHQPNGILTDGQAPNAKVETLAPKMPENALSYIQLIKSVFEDTGGFTPTTSGQGDPNMRSGAQANVALRTSSPRLRDRALIVEDQCAELAGKCFALSRVKDARVFSQPKKGGLMGVISPGQEFMLSQLPQDAVVGVDSHTSSPAFSGDNMQLAFALAARQAIDGEDLIKMTHPPRQDELVIAYREREEQKAEMIRQHPELLQQHGKKKS
jgi:hypothetical protein